MHSPESGIDLHIPPVPPIPQSLSSTLPHTRHLSAEAPRKPSSRSQSLLIDHLSNRLSKKLELPPLASAGAGPSDNPTSSSAEKPVPGNNPRPPLPQPPSRRSASHDNLSNHSLSNPSSPPPSPSPNFNATSSDPAAVSIRRSQLPPSLNLSSPSTVADGEDSSRLRPTLTGNQDEPQRTGASFNTMRTGNTMGSATSGEDITKVLSTYRFVSPLKSSFPVHLHESPDPSTPSLSPGSGGSRSHRTNTSSSISLPQTPNSATKRSRDGGSLCVIRNPQA